MRTLEAQHDASELRETVINADGQEVLPIPDMPSTACDKNVYGGRVVTKSGTHRLGRA